MVVPGGRGTVCGDRVTKERSSSAVNRHPQVTGHGTLARIMPRSSSFQGSTMEGSVTDHVYKVVELVGSSKDSIEDAIRTAIKRADATLRNLRWFEVVQTRGHVEN